MSVDATSKTALPSSSRSGGSSLSTSFSSASAASAGSLSIELSPLALELGAQRRVGLQRLVIRMRV